MSDNNNDNVNNNSGHQTPFSNAGNSIKNKALEKAAKGAATAFGGPAAGKVAGTAVKALNCLNNGNSSGGLKNNLMKKAAKGAATAFGGPAAGKAAEKGVDVLNKVKNGRNRLQRPNNNGQPSGDTSTNSEGNTNNKSPLGGLSPLGLPLGGGSSGAAGSSAGAAEMAQKLFKMKKLLPLLGAAGPFLLGFIIIAVIVVVIVSNFAAIEEFVAEVQVGVEKLVNFSIGEGWMTNEDAFFKRLKDENTRYKQITNEDLDIPLIASTIHYNNIVNPSAYEEKEIKNVEEFKEEDTDSALVDTNKTSTFYGVAGDLLGHANTLTIGERKLIGHLVRANYKWATSDNLNDTLDGWKKFLNVMGHDNDVCNNDIQEYCLFFYHSRILKMYKNEYEYSKQYKDILAYPKFQAANYAYEVGEMKNGLSGLSSKSSEIVGDESTFDNYTEAQIQEYAKKNYSSGWLSYPTIEYTIDYEGYKKYLKEVFIPYTIFNGEAITDEINLKIDSIIDEIFAQKDYYNYLFHNKNEDGDGEICYSNLSNIKVKLYSCGSGHTGVEKYYVETVSFDDYVKGVILAEEGGVITNKSNEEFVKAFILTAKSYTLGRGVRYMNPSYFDLNSPVIEVELQNCSNDQNYKSYKNATSAQKEVIERLYNEVSNQILVTNADSTRVKQAGYMNNASNACGSHDCSEGNGSIMNVTEAAKLSQQGYTYDKILTYYYGSKYAIKNIDNNCSSTGTVSGEFTSCKQYGNNSWSQIQIGCGTVHHCGCLATSVAIQIANAANNGGLKLKVDKFDPYVFITTLKQNGGFSSGGSFQWKGWNSITDNWYCDGGSFIYGSVAERAAELKRKMNDGWYPIVNVKYGGCGEHYVAIIAVNGSTITMADPASTQTNLSNSSKYPCFVNGKTSRVRYCKVK